MARRGGRSGLDGVHAAGETRMRNFKVAQLRFWLSALPAP